MSDTNPIVFSQSIKAVLARYISTTLPISRRYPKLGSEFRRLLDQEQLVQGPYVEALPDFEKGKSLAELLTSAGGFLHDGLGKLPMLDRPLHLHQEKALRHAVLDRESFLTATGTGSGKTETFLYPIAHDLLSDPDPQRPGVRALLVYPMNALANDQLYYRVAPLFGRYLKEYGITFGRYTGQVKSSAKRDDEEAHIWSNPKLLDALGNPSSIPKNWMLTRDEMLADPPKVLITNYAMLEHMLLLPRNAGLFATNSLRFIVLDEIHTYRGAQATEVAFLLRKLKVRLGVEQSVQVFGTSASLSDSATADDELKTFASDLLGEDVSRVIRGKRNTHIALSSPVSATYSMSPAQWIALGEVMQEFVAFHREEQTVDCWNVLISACDGLPAELTVSGNSQNPASAALVDVFARNEEVRSAAKALEGGLVLHFSQLAQLVFETYSLEASDAEAALSAVIQCGMVARRIEGDFPLLPGRYHMAVNSVEGVVVRPDGSAEGWAKARVGRSYQDDVGHYYPLLTCRKCGQPFLEGWKDQTHIHPLRPDSGEGGAAQRMVFWLGIPFVGTADEEDESSESEAESNSSECIFVQPKTGEISANEGAIALYPVHIEKDDVERALYVKRCPACGGRATGADAEVVTRMHPGNESLSAVVAQRVVEALPPGVVDHADPRPAFGRSVLAFSDNRQDAAFFAPYFERTSANVALRSAVRAVLDSSSSAVSMSQLAERVFEHWRSDGGQALLLNGAGEIRTDKHDVSQLLLGSLAYEFCTPAGRRNSLESLGVALVTYDEAKLRLLVQQVKGFLPEGLPSDADSIAALCYILLETIRRERAFESLSGLAMNDHAIWGDYNQHRTFDVEAGDAQVKFRWLPGQGKRHNRRSWYLVEQLGLDRTAASDFLRHFWMAITRPPISMMKRFPPGFGMDGNLLRVKNGLGLSLYQCQSCGLRQQHVVSSKCSAFNCRGEVIELDAQERSRMRRENHYLASYEETNHLTLRAREHTASLSTELREQIEREFAERRINLLSCTTTMEMGVDLGDLEAVINLNVPPGIANYQQRTGRAGRRAQAAPFCVTVARSTNYDQLMFRHLKEYLSDSPTTPFINLANKELFLRHQMSVVLSYLLKHALDKKVTNAPLLKNLFGEVLHEKAKEAFYDKLHAWIDSSAGIQAFAEAEVLGDKLPAGHAQVVHRGVELKNAVVGRLKEFSEDVAERCRSYVEKKIAAATTEDYRKATYWTEQLEKYMGQFLVTELSRRGLIPTYSFPVHSLTLEVQDGSTFNRYQSSADISLNRDASLGLSEYAPGAEVIANGRIWESAGLASYPKAFMPTRWYAVCPGCFHVDMADAHLEVPDACSNCGCADSTRRKRMFLEPKGFVTSTADSKGKDPGTSRRRVKPADEARLIALPRQEHFQETEIPFLSTALLLARGSEDNDLKGSLFVANRGAHGEGYRRCLLCNYCEPISKVQKSKSRSKKTTAASAATAKKFIHTDPSTGAACKSDFMPKMGVDFAHMFSTDVRLLRFLAPLPESPEGIVADRLFQERVARTVAEACRLAASDMLNLYPSELRSTYRLYTNAGCIAEVVLYDGVPGGAGYSARLGTPQFSFTALMERALKRLECPQDCDSACRACLCDYGNQRYWDSFRRKEAFAWLKALIDGKSIAVGPGSYVPWVKPSLSGLSERLALFSSISIIATSLGNSIGYQDDELRQLLAWLHSGKNVHLYVVNKLEQKPSDYPTLAMYRYLYPWLQGGQLQISALPLLDGRRAGQLPRIFTALDDGALMVRQIFPVQALFDGLISAPAELGAMDAETRALLADVLEGAELYAPEYFSEGENMGMWEFPVDTPRPLAEIFTALKGLHIKSLDVRDPYCGTARSRPLLKQLLTFLKEHVAALEKVDVYCSQVKERQHDGSDYIEHRLDVARFVEEVIDEVGIKGGEAIVKELGRNRTFHDRELIFDAVDAAGCSAIHRYFLTGGIDYLLDERSDTKVFHAVVSN